MSAGPSLRYVVLHHEGVAQPHFDLMFEESPGSPLLTWRCDRWPVVTGNDAAVTALPPHRAAYLDYEGPVSGKRGFVRRVESGTYRPGDEVGAFIATLADGRVITIRDDTLQVT